VLFLHEFFHAYFFQYDLEYTFVNYVFRMILRQGAPPENWLNFFEIKFAEKNDIPVVEYGVLLTPPSEKNVAMF
jgi:hypothetical protein